MTRDEAESLVERTINMYFALTSPGEEDANDMAVTIVSFLQRAGLELS